MQLQRIPKWFLVSVLLLALAGFLDASYLTIKHYSGGSIPCPVLGGCDIVTTSKYSQIFGLPVSLYGAIYYLSILISLVAYWDSKKELLIKWVVWVPFLGLIFSGWFMYVQYFLIKSFCFYCIVSALISLVLSILSLRVLQLNKG
ncbi:MAG TPA: vitamin K epoxide reductase family protein [Candidatus Paceibacterota bacterium]